jgi:hypothetical protein
MYSPTLIRDEVLQVGEPRIQRWERRVDEEQRPGRVQGPPILAVL